MHCTARATLRTLQLLLVSCCALVPAVWPAPAGAEPADENPARGIPAGPDVPTSAQLERRLLAHNLRTSVEAYKASGMRDPKWDAAAVAFLEAVERRVLDLPGAAAPADLERQGRLVYLQGCDDPMVLYDYGRVWEMLGNREQAGRFLRPAADALAKSGYPANRRAYAAKHALDACTAGGDKEAAARYADRLASGVGDLLGEGAYGKDRALLLYALRNMCEGLSAEQRLAVWGHAKSARGAGGGGGGGADPVAVLMLEGEYHIAAAWEARGGGWAGTVKPKGWEGFEAHLDHARDCLIRAYQLDRTVHEPAVCMITVAMGGGDADEMRLWLGRALASRLDDGDALDRYRYGLYPRWLGGRQALLAFAEECFATRRFDTVLPLQYVYALADVREECDGGATPDWGLADVYDKAHEAFEKALAPNGARPGDAHVRSMEAAFAVQAGRWADARAALDQLHGDPEAKATEIFKLTPAEVVGAAFAYTGPASRDALAGRDLDVQGRRKEALASYQAALAAAKAALEPKKDARDTKDPGGAAARYLRGVVRRLEWETAFEAGGAVALKADADFSGLHPTRGKWAADADGGLIATGAPDRHEPTDQHLYLWCDADFGDRWEFKADVDFLRAGADWTSAGLTLCPPGTWEYVGLALGPGQQKFFVRRTNHDESARGDAHVERSNRLVLRRDGTRLTLTLNGQPLYQGPCADDADHRLRIGFGGWPVAPGDVIRFRQMEFRRVNP